MRRTEQAHESAYPAALDDGGVHNALSETRSSVQADATAMPLFRSGQGVPPVRYWLNIRNQAEKSKSALLTMRA